MQTSNVYLDNNGTTLLDARVLEAMLPYLQNQYDEIEQFIQSIKYKLNNLQ